MLVWWMTICALTKEQQQAVNVALMYSYVHCVSVNKCISFSVSTVVSYLLEKCQGWGPCWKRKTDFGLHVVSSGTIPKVLWAKWGLCASSSIHSATIGQNLHRVTSSNTFTLLYKEAADIYSYITKLMLCNNLLLCNCYVMMWRPCSSSQVFSFISTDQIPAHIECGQFIQEGTVQINKTHGIACEIILELVKRLIFICKSPGYGVKMADLFLAPLQAEYKAVGTSLNLYQLVINKQHTVDILCYL